MIIWQILAKILAGKLLKNSFLLFIFQWVQISHIVYSTQFWKWYKYLLIDELGNYAYLKAYYYSPFLKISLVRQQTDFDIIMYFLFSVVICLSGKSIIGSISKSDSFLFYIASFNLSTQTIFSVFSKDFLARYFYFFDFYYCF
jgi:hypothetical protein